MAEQKKARRSSAGKKSKSTSSATQRSQATSSNSGVKNRSQRSERTPGAKAVPIGRTVKTKDKYLPHDPKKVQELKDKRWVVVIDKNTNEELAVVRLTDEKQPNTTELPTYKKGNKRKTFFKHFVEIEDSEGKAIRIDGEKFIANASKYDLSKEEINIVQSIVRAHSKQAKSNKEKLKKLKSRK